MTTSRKRVAETTTTRVSKSLFLAAQEAAPANHRSAREQLEHWAAVGRAITDTESVGLKRLEAAMRGELGREDLNSAEASAFDAEVEAGILSDLEELDFADEMNKRGYRAVALDENGVLTEYLPEGTTRPLPQ